MEKPRMARVIFQDRYVDDKTLDYAKSYQNN